MKPLSTPLKQPLSILLFFTASILVAKPLHSQLVADFSSTITSGCSPILVDFTDQSSGNPAEWKWDLGNGTFSNLKNPSVTYFNPGVYTVKLLVKNAAHRDSVIKTNYITVFQSSAVDFTADFTVGCSPFTVHFTDQTMAAGVASWQWDFGDGLLSGVQNPVHTYELPGTYNVTLKIINVNGCISTLRKTGYIQNNNVKANFLNRIATPCVPDKIAFQNTSTGTGTLSYNWSFGDGTFSNLSNPIHIFTTEGIYTVKLVTTNQFGCTDSMSKTVTTTKQVTAAFVADKVFNCTSPATINFTSQPTPGNSYHWNFGDGTSSTAANPSHVYEDTGVFSVRLVVKNTNGCADSLLKQEYISIRKPFIHFGNLPDSGCVPFTKSFIANNGSAENIVSHLWNFGDGTTSSLQDPVHTYSATGYYNVSLICLSSNGCSDTISMANAIHVTTLPTASFAANTQLCCANSVVTFTDLTTGNPTSWTWSFGDNVYSGDRNPTHMYKDTGWMDVQLIAMNGGCSNTITLENYIYIKPPVARFNILFSCDKPFLRTFNNYSIGADRCLWNFGDGSVSTDYRAVHNYTTPGSYNVTLTVWNDSTGCDYTLTKRVKIIDAASNFWAEDTSICRGTGVGFSTLAVNPDIIKYTWRFGDDTIYNSRLNIASHVYELPGTYTVQLITVDSLNCKDTINRPLYIKVHGPQAGFSVLNNGGCPGETVHFSDNSIAETGNPIKSWAWNFGDGILETLAGPPFRHNYTTQGSYNVLLQVTDSLNCTDTFRLTPSLVIRKPVSKFYVSDSSACPGFPVKFICPYAEPGVTYVWDFGDGTSSAAQIVNHSYATEGIYTVRLKLMNKYGCADSSIILNAVKVKRTVAMFNMSDSFRTCPPLLIEFTSGSVNTQGEYWNFGDSTYTDTHSPSHFYTYPGIYNATLVAKGPGGCSDTASRRIIVKGPKGSIQYNPLKICRPYTINFTANTEDAVSYIWDFNDGVTLPNTDTAVTYTYRDSGNFVPKLIMIDDIGCRVPVTGRDTLKNIFVDPYFSFPDSLLCDGGAVSFANTTTSNDNIAVVEWSFGDGTVSQQLQPIHPFTLPGIFYPSLKVTTETGCVETYHSAVPVRVALSPDISISASGDGCAPLHVNMAAVNNRAADAVSWQWTMDNGSTSGVQNPPEQVYNEPGVYTISLTANSTNGCGKTIQKKVESYALPRVTITGGNFICRGAASSLTAGGAARYKWLPDPSLDCDTCGSVIAKPALPTTYMVTGTSLQGCKGSDSFVVNVKQPFEMKVSGPVALCAGQRSRMEATGADHYQWSPGNGLSNASLSNPVAQPDTTINYRVVGTDIDGCFNDTGYVKLTVYNYPTVFAGEDQTTSEGIPVDLKPLYSADVTSVRWSPTTDVFRNGDSGITVKPVTSTEYTIEVKNAGGCMAADRVKVIVNFGSDNVFIPNAFSPNGDGTNEVFYPRGRGIYKVKKMMIFNRWGEVIFERSNFNSNDPSAGWDGSFKGIKLNNDVFVYIIELIGNNGTVLPLKGDITLVN